MLTRTFTITRRCLGRVAAFAALIGAPLLGPSLAAQITIQGTASSGSTYYNADPFMGTSSYITYSVPSVSNFTYNFNSVGDIEMSVTWSAPVGQKFVVTAPTGFSAGYLTLRFSGGSQGGGGGTFTASSPTVTITDASGSLTGGNAIFSLADPSFSSPSFIVQYSGSLSGSETFSFTSLKVSATVPAAYNTNFPGDFTSFNISASASAFGSPVANPGAWLSLTTTAVPEPSTYAAIFGACALGVVVAIRRRRAVRG